MRRGKEEVEAKGHEVTKSLALRTRLDKAGRRDPQGLTLPLRLAASSSSSVPMVFENGRRHWT
jgi:hypothetical protein